ncbi:Serine/threonine-protein kinase tel1 [Ophidiomyces ophidiicola]|nr:Serine/threonine-protein kinase tel1 [Ophidiomyces ophidiicola]KAI1924637.1 Serine/threonine-protein kinase tel1 [Ophidiomyces ophidiicola]KAI1955044.1 Serine/threonine-protein kinase tel1 [Ophidiomyces ophidiicola]KAI2122807.1 Serine/threonine-protein kinase tel1 [Ophidiomyces ophidiicola]KAI2310646.1 Serine/threonine-protein kinase tel1 [Ophidiomyces ophidiicola]
MRQVSIIQALDSLSSSRLRDRTEGIEELRHILVQNKRIYNLHLLDDKGYHRIFEALFRCISRDKSAFNQAHKSSLRSSVTTRLSSCASLLQKTAELSTKVLRPRTVIAVICHIVDTLPSPGEDLWVLLCSEYVNALLAILKYQPHVEHLSKEEWHCAVDFCLLGLGVTKRQEHNQLPIRDGDLVLESAGDRGSRAGSMGPQTYSRGGNNYADFRDNAEVFELCIQLLTAPSVSPILDGAGKILHGLTDYLLSNMAGRSPHVPFNTINLVLARAITDDIALVQEIIFSLLPVIRRLWPSKSVQLRDEMLITLMYAKDILTTGRVPHSFPVEMLQDLLEQILRAYVRLPEKEILHIDDLIFSFDMDSIPMALRFMAPRLAIGKSVQLWMTVSTLAALSKLVDELLLTPNPSSGDSGKRQQLSSRIDDIFRDATTSSGVTRICALQTIPFIIFQGNISSGRTQNLVRLLIPYILDESTTVSSWSMIALASIAACECTTSKDRGADWRHIWDLTSRTLPSLGTSRAACVLMCTIVQHHLLDYSDIVDTLESISYSADLNGPAALTDSALYLWKITMELKSKVNPAQSQETSRQICGWLQSTWTIGLTTDRLHSSQIAWFARPLNILNLLMSCTGRQLTAPTATLDGPFCRLAKAWIVYHQKHKLVRYLLLVNPQTSLDNYTVSLKGADDIESSTRYHPNDLIILEFLQAKLDSFSQMWSQLSTDKANHITLEITQALVSACVTANAFIEMVPSHCLQAQNLRKSTDDLWVNICKCISENFVMVQHCLDVLSPLVLSLMPPFNRNGILLKALGRMSLELLPLLKQQRETERDRADQTVESMELDDQFLSRDIPYAQDGTMIRFNREDNGSPIFEDSDSMRIATTVQLSLLGLFLSVEDSAILTNEIHTYIKTWDSFDMLAGWPYLTKFISSIPNITRFDACTFIEIFGERCLRSHELRRCEASISACIEIMTCFVDLWTTNESDELQDSASDVYIWFIDILLGEEIGGPMCLVRLAVLLERILSNNPVFLREHQRPSPRTSLFSILSRGDLTVKFNISCLISKIFGGFILKEHDAIFDDVLANLPRDREWEEGIAIRLFILAELASHWHTLLRRGIYHIFEAPGQVPSSTLYARECLNKVAKALGLVTSREVFRLFSPQIIYTWMETQSLSDLPFSVFGYTHLKELMLDVQDEVIAQVIMRAREDEMSELSRCLGLPFRELLSSCFYKAEAYSLARDISMPPSQDPMQGGSEVGMKTLLGSNDFLTLVEKFFPEIVASLFKSMDQTEQMERHLAKHELFQSASKILRAIHERGASTMILPIGQQPSFRARFLLDELEFLCRRSGYDLETMWTPALVCFVARALVESIHPAFGSLHACSVLRKLRILICVAGSTVLEDYPLEMLLHCLRPFLTNFQCSADAIGMFWYLVDNGRLHLSEHPSFLAGLAVSTLASLRGLLCSQQESTTQETHFRATMSNAQTFHKWFLNFLDEYEAPALNEAEKISLRKIIQLSQNISGVGNASNSTYEGELMVELLQDKVSGRNLLGRAASDLVFDQLCRDFQRPESFRDYILGNDQAACSNAAGLWDMLENREPSSGCRLWVARALGRSYSSTGSISELLLREQRMIFSNYPSYDTLMTSKVSILRVLCNSLFSNNNASIGVAERTLQTIVNTLLKDSKLEQFEEAIPVSLMKGLIWAPYHCPKNVIKYYDKSSLGLDVRWAPSLSVLEFAKDFTLALSLRAGSDPVLSALQPILFTIPTLAAQLLPYILHDVLLSEHTKGRKTRQAVSAVFQEAFDDVQKSTLPHLRLMIYCILYLRHQPYPNEMTMDMRDSWLEIDYLKAANAATKCRMYKTALLFVEIHYSHLAVASRRSSAIKPAEPSDLLHEIFSSIDDPDMFYGMQQNPSIDSVLEKLGHESASLKNMTFQSANYDTDLKLDLITENNSTLGVIKAFNSTNFQGMVNVMFHTPGKCGKRPETFDSMLSTALYLQKWDIPVPNTTSSIGNLFKALQGLNVLENKSLIVETLDDCFLEMLNQLSEDNQSLSSQKNTMRMLGLLSEMDEILSSTSCIEIQESWNRIVSRSSWLRFESFHDIGLVLSTHEGFFSIINQRPQLQTIFGLKASDAQLLRVRTIRESFRISREHDEHQASLKSAMLLTKLVDPCSQLEVKIDAAATLDLANVFWDQGEMTPSIQMLQQLSDRNDLQKQSIPINRAEVLASLGRHIAEARLEKPDVIIQNYLLPAVKELKGQHTGEEAGLAFHEFASFCDQQLQNPEVLEDFKRIEQIRHRKEREVQDLERMMKGSQGKEKEQLRIHKSKAKQWFDLDDREYQRLKRSRETFLEQCLENYLLSLKACDTFGNDVLRFCALWLDNSNSDIANKAVGKHLFQVPSRKFAPLMNQLSSRLLESEDYFQPLLSALVFRICVEHPYHGMYQIFASSKSKVGNDQMAVSRFNAAGRLVERLKVERGAGSTWVAIHNTNISCVRFALEKTEEKLKTGSKIQLRKSLAGQRLEQDVRRQRIPPPTMKIELRVDCDYSKVPRWVEFLPEFSVASGISAPKIVTAIASDGLRYKALFKAGNDDLRQDAIMEQVFEQVSNLLRSHRATQQRDLGIRTYKVLPLTTNVGIIEFVQDTIPLHDYLLPAHQKHFPKDMKPNACRKHINDAQAKSLEQRLRVYRQVTDHFHPVMKYFFMERFQNPDDWFSKRLAYIRSTAAISILGHVLGLGDRHGHNILLDEMTGEVVHIDLGVAFEQGRVLPVPEVVPFRLTRDLVDGMGVTKTEGVFRRCCEFTLETLRQESYSIMTILDVLRYDPLYSWSLSPLRMKKMQDSQDADEEEDETGERAKASVNEPSEADRALTVVAKKLGKTLSVVATVNELIQQATDERNLAVLYCGWAAYA